RDPPAEGLAQQRLGVVHGAVVGAGVVGGAVGGATALGRGELRVAVGQAGDHHAVVQEGQQHRQEGALLPAVETGGGGEGGGGLADQLAVEPQAAGAVE